MGLSGSEPHSDAATGRMDRHHSPRVSRRRLLSSAAAAGGATAAATVTGLRAVSPEMLSVRDTSAPAAAPEPSGRSTPPIPGSVSIRDFAGSNDAQRMEAALGYVAAQTQKPAVHLPPGTQLDLAQRSVEPGQPYRLFDGLTVAGTPWLEREFGTKNEVVVSGAPSVFRLLPGSDSRTVDVSFIGISWRAGAEGVDFIESVTDLRSGPYLAYSTIRDCGFNLFRRVHWGRHLGVRISGEFYCNNSTETPLYLSGSDNRYFTDGGFLDSPRMQDDAYLLRFGSMSKTYVGPVFITGDGPTPIRVDGGRHIVFNNVQAEAQGQPRATAGAGIYITGGLVTLRDVWVYNVMANPSATGRDDQGMIHVTGGDVLIDGAVFGAGGSPSASAPCIYASGGRTTVRSCRAESGRDLVVEQARAELVDADVPVTLR